MLQYEASASASASAGGSDGPHFSSERVELTLSPGRLAVQGRYTFQHRGSQPWRGRIGYPILVGAGQKPPSRVLRDEAAELAVRCREPEQCAAVLDLELAAGETRSLRLSYEQELTGNRAAYLITSARRWKRALERAELVVRVPADWRDVSLSYPPDRQSVADGYRTLELVRRDFLPDCDLVVTWEE